ncbi:MAG: sigma 54-interacting transcriptional regulator [Burkholderiales bacterium]|nr:sigma 54-interacting transcriptional regulator [Burkholderiales bacterium]MDR4518820.1 RNA repair transcriptional activator RtcR [Nitrosomonas sp.]
MDNIVIGILGSRLDHGGLGKGRFGRWRPTVSVAMQKDFPLARLELIHHVHEQALAELTAADIRALSPGMQVNLYAVDYDDPWDFETVYSQLHAFAEAYPFDPERENYFVHITTGTHVAQICLFLLTEARFIPAKLLQSSPGKQGDPNALYGSIQIIDLDLSKYDQIASRFANDANEANKYLKGGVETRNAAFNRMIEQIEQVALRSTAPILLTGPTGAGKSRLAKRIYTLKQQRMHLSGRLVEVNCATLRGDNAMSALFGHVKGAFTGAQNERTGLLREANNGLLFLDEIGELGLDEQAMLLRALEDKVFMPFGGDKEVSSDFQLIAGTNRKLHEQVKNGRFREDLLARINLWTYELPSLKDRIEDLEPNLHYELKKATQLIGYKVSFNQLALKRYLDFGMAPNAVWHANFRDLNASVMRMAILADGGRITEEIVNNEISRLQTDWKSLAADDGNHSHNALEKYLSEEAIEQLDLFERLQLAEVIQVCKNCKTMAEAGRILFNVSRRQKNSSNDTNRLKVYLKRFGLIFSELR